jgi:hypothetical protein
MVNFRWKDSSNFGEIVVKLSHGQKRGVKDAALELNGMF